MNAESGQQSRGKERRVKKRRREKRRNNAEHRGRGKSKTDESLRHDDGRGYCDNYVNE